MNIFVLDESPIFAARCHCDKHVNKMLIEYSQMLCTAIRLNNGTEYIEKSKSNRNVKRWRLDDEHYDKVLYKATHVNHPSNVWVRRSADNFKWLYHVADELASIYSASTGKTHACEPILDEVYMYYETHGVLFNSALFTPVTLAMPDEFKIGSQDSWGDVVASYRNLYNKSKSRFATFGKYNNPTPWWYKPEFTEDVNL